MNRPSNSLRAAARRVVAGGLLLFSLVGLYGWWNAMFEQWPWTVSATDPSGLAFSLALSVAVTAMFVGVAVASLGVATETFDRHRVGYLRAMRICGAVGLVGVGGLLVAIVVAGL